METGVANTFKQLGDGGRKPGSEISIKTAG